MDISKLEDGMTFKNYKEMCAFLGEKVKNGKSKTLQLSEWSKYFSFSKDKHSFTIESLNNIPKIKKSDRFGIVEMIELLIIDLLDQPEHRDRVFLSKAGLFKALNMVNDNFNFGRYQHFGLSNFLSISLDEVKEFYDLSTNAMTRSVENALKRLTDKSLIEWKTSKTVCALKANYETNQYGEARVNVQKIKSETEETSYKWEFKNHVQYNHREATTQEVVDIIETERLVMEKMKTKGKQEIVRSKRWNEFTDQVNDILTKNFNILYYYESYDITFSHKLINEISEDLQKYELTDDDRVKTRKDVNAAVQDKLSYNANRRHADAIKNKELEEKFNKEYRLGEDYIKNNQKLIDKLINEDQLIRYKKKGANIIEVKKYH